MFPELPADFDRDVERWSTDLAQFETHTKEDYAWRRANLTDRDMRDFVCDCHDGFKWEEATAFNILNDTMNGRAVLMANVGFRVYRTEGKKIRTDERGTYDGWSNRYDEWVPVFSPRIHPHLTRVNQVLIEDDDFDADLDDLMPPESGHDRVYAVPRISSCISSKFVHFMNLFGHLGGFAAILQALAEQAPGPDCTLTTMGYLITMISMPSKLFHKDWLAEFAGAFTAAMRSKLLGAPDKILKDVSANDVNQIQISINSINGRVMERDQAKQEAEKLKLEIAKKCLSSELLERRILGIKELNAIIRTTQLAYGAARVFTMEWLMGWMSEHGVFDIIWDTKKTHLQLVQRSNEIFKALPKEHLLSMELLQQFWSLGKSDYKSEVFKILNEAAFHLEQEHVEYLFDQITETPAAKLGMEEFDALSTLGRFSRSPEFQARTSDFFWRIIVDSDGHKQELLENCINKFADMIKFKLMDKKQPYFDKLVEQLRTGRSSAVPVIRLFKQIIKDQKAQMSYKAAGTGGDTTATQAGQTTVKHGTIGAVGPNRSFTLGSNSTGL